MRERGRRGLVRSVAVLILVLGVVLMHHVIDGGHGNHGQSASLQASAPSAPASRSIPARGGNDVLRMHQDHSAAKASTLLASAGVGPTVALAPDHPAVAVLGAADHAMPGMLMLHLCLGIVVAVAGLTSLVVLATIGGRDDDVLTSATRYSRFPEAPPPRVPLCLAQLQVLRI